MGSPVLWELELPTAAIGAFQGCGVRTLIPCHLSAIKISVLNLHSGVGREGVSEPLGQGWVPEWEQDREHGHSLSLVALAAPPAEGETEARAAPTAGMVMKADPTTSNVVFLHHLFIFSCVPKALLCCKPRVFRKRRDGEVLQAQRNLHVPCETKPDLGAWWLRLSLSPSPFCLERRG